MIHEIHEDAIQVSSYAPALIGETLGLENGNHSRFQKRLKSDQKEMTMQWNTPAFAEMRYGFEVTMYICNR